MTIHDQSGELIGPKLDPLNWKIFLLDFFQGMKFHVIIYQKRIEKRKSHFGGQEAKRAGWAECFQSSLCFVECIGLKSWHGP